MYLDNAIQNTIKRLIKKESGYFYNVSLVDDLEYVSTEDIIPVMYEVKETTFKIFSDFEKIVYKKFYEEELSPKKISDLMFCEDKKIYNALGRIKTKLKERDIDFDNRDLEIKNLDLDKLSGLEYRVFRFYARGYKTSDIAYELGRTFAQVSNALSRAKNKLK